MLEEFVLTEWVQMSRLSTVHRDPMAFYEIEKKDALFSNKIKTQMFLYKYFLLLSNHIFRFRSLCWSPILNFKN